MLVRRIDAVTLLPRTDADVSIEGFHLYDALFARVGTQDYSDGRGGIITEWRPDGEVFSDPSLGSYELRPLTDLHPAHNVTTDSARFLARGAVSAGRKHEDGRHVAGRLAVWDRALQDKFAEAAASSGPMQLSAGYVLDLDETPGTTPDGRRFDAIQRNIRINHVAAVPLGRAGTARVLDSADFSTAWDLGSAGRFADIPAKTTRVFVDMGTWCRRDASDLRTQLTTTKEHMKIKFKFDGVDAVIEVADGSNPQQIADAVAKLHADKAKTPKPKTDSDSKEFDAAVSAQARKLVRDAFGAPPGKKGEEEEEEKDGKKADAFDVKLELAKFKAGFKADSDARTDALSSTKAVMGVDYSGAGKSVAQIQLDAIDELLGKEEVADIAGLPEAHRDGATAHAFARAMKAHQGRATHADGTLAEIQQTRVDAAKRAAAAPQQDKTLKAREDAIKRAALSRAERDEQSQKAS